MVLKSTWYKMLLPHILQLAEYLNTQQLDPLPMLEPKEIRPAPGVIRVAKLIFVFLPDNDFLFHQIWPAILMKTLQVFVLLL
ncbi:hypothetical protein D3C85_1104220 [compost metagenome]